LSLIELARAYTTFVNGSKPSTPIFITRIEDKNGNLIASDEDLNPITAQDQVFSDDTRQISLEFLKATVNEGTAQRLRTTYNLKNDIAGKTGTTQENKDGWFVGMTPKLVTVIWVGNDDQQIGFSNTSIGQGANSALPIFAKYLQQLNRDSKFNAITRANFEKPSKRVLRSLNCEPTKKENFFQRLFSSGKEKKEFKKKKRGFFWWLKRKKN
jgi:penicillin-binding protein 1A